MARKPGPRKGSKQPRKSAKASNTSATGEAKRTTARRKAPAHSKASSEQAEKQTGGSRLAALVKSPFVRNVLAATMVSAAGALLFNRRGDKRGDEVPADEPASSPPIANQSDPLVAAGVAAKGRKRRSAATPARRRRSNAGAETAEPAEAGPGAYPDGSPSGDSAGRTSIEGGGSDHRE